MGFKYTEHVDAELTQEQVNELNKGGFGDTFDYTKESPYYKMKAGDRVKWLYKNGYIESEVNLLIQFGEFARVTLEYKKAGLN